MTRPMDRIELVPWSGGDLCRKAGFINLGPREFEYPKGHWMTCNDWAIDLRAEPTGEHG